MYAWIWRKLPFGLYGKIGASLILAGAISALLWFVVFPWIEPFVMPFDDVQVGNPDNPGIPASPTPTDDPYAVPYETIEPSPSTRG